MSLDLPKLRFVAEALHCMARQDYCLEGEALQGLVDIVDDVCLADAEGKANDRTRSVTSAC